MESTINEILNNPSGLSRTWFFDLDGTLLVHNEWLDQPDQLLPGVLDMFDQIPEDDMIIITTARTGYLQRDQTVAFLEANGIPFDHIIFDLPIGERIVVNDIKPKGLKTAIGVNVKRNAGFR